MIVYSQEDKGKQRIPIRAESKDKMLVVLIYTHLRQIFWIFNGYFVPKIAGLNLTQ